MERGLHPKFFGRKIQKILHNDLNTVVHLQILAPCVIPAVRLVGNLPYIPVFVKFTTGCPNTFVHCFRELPYNMQYLSVPLDFLLHFTILPGSTQYVDSNRRVQTLMLKEFSKSRDAIAPIAPL